MNSQVRIRSLCIIGLIGLATVAEAQRPGRPLIDDVVRAMGGDRVLSISTLTLEGTGTLSISARTLRPTQRCPCMP